jgi:hypothetical protein
MGWPYNKGNTGLTELQVHFSIAEGGGLTIRGILGTQTMLQNCCFVEEMIIAKSFIN